MWEQTFKIIESRKEKIESFLKDIHISSRKVILTGAGTSAFVGSIVAPFMNHVAKTICAVDTTTLLTHPLNYIDKDEPLLLISFARSGNSPESIAVSNLINELAVDVKELIVTCNHNGQLAQKTNSSNCLVVLLPPETNDLGFAMTSSFTSMYLAILRIFNIPIHMSEVIKGAHTIINEKQNLIQDYTDKSIKRIVYLASGPLEGLAKEAALKTLELTSGKIATFFNTPLGFRHGPKSILDENTLTVLFASDDSYVRLYEADLLGEIEKSNTLVISHKPFDNMDRQISYQSNNDLHDYELVLIDIIVVQCLAFMLSLVHEINPDNPSPSGLVNRVVKGVTIYPFKEG